MEIRRLRTVESARNVMLGRRGCPVVCQATVFGQRFGWTSVDVFGRARLYPVRSHGARA